MNQNISKNADVEWPQPVVDQVINLVHERSGISIDAGKTQMIESRLRRRLRAVDIDNPSDYLDYLEKQPAEYEHFTNAFTTNETSFFRTARIWRYLEEDLFEQWADKPKAARQVWSAAGSTGEEAYSLAMACDMFNVGRTAPLRMRILASDISTDVVAKAKEGSYQGRTISRLKVGRPEALLGYFVEHGECFNIIPKIKESVQFKQHNLFKKPPFKNHFDLVMLRNVLIYFTDRDQEQVLSRVYDSIQPGGILVLGESESLNTLDTNFKFIKPFIYQKPG